MASVAAVVDRALRQAGVPIIGVAIGKPTDRTTWIITFDPAATATDRTTAATVLTTVAIDAAALAQQDQREAQGQIDNIPLVWKAMMLALVDQINVLRAGLPAPLAPITPAQAITQIRNKAGTLS